MIFLLFETLWIEIGRSIFNNLSLKGKVIVVIIGFDLMFIALSNLEHYAMAWSTAILKQIVEAKWRVKFQGFLYHSSWSQSWVLQNFWRCSSSHSTSLVWTLIWKYIFTRGSIILGEKNIITFLKNMFILFSYKK